MIRGDDDDDDEKVYTFVAEWFDPRPQIIKKYLLKYFCDKDEIEMKDLTTNRKFLKRTKIPCSNNTPSIQSSDFIIGNNIVIFSRDLKLVDYGDSMTRDALDSSTERAAIFFQNADASTIGPTIDFVEQKGFTLSGLRVVSFSKEHQNDDATEVLLGVKELLLISSSFQDEDDDNTKLNILLIARGKQIIDTIGNIQNDLKRISKAVCVVTSADLMKRGINTEQVEVHFQQLKLRRSETNKRQQAISVRQSTCCIIKPHIIKQRKGGELLNAIISKGYQILNIKMFQLSHQSAKEFYAPYVGVLPDYNKAVDNLCTGPIIVLQLTKRLSSSSIDGDTDIVQAFRSTVGPWDVEIAKKLFPDTLRAQFGRSRSENAIHCSDLPEDAADECHYFFQILDD